MSTTSRPKRSYLFCIWWCWSVSLAWSCLSLFPLCHRNILKFETTPSVFQFQARRWDYRPYSWPKLSIYSIGITMKPLSLWNDLPMGYGATTGADATKKPKRVDLFLCLTCGSVSPWLEWALSVRISLQFHHSWRSDAACLSIHFLPE